jgi:hypothetical protein
VACEYFIMQVANTHFWQWKGDGVFFGQHGMSSGMSTAGIAWTCTAIAIDEKGVASGERTTPIAMKNAKNPPCDHAAIHETMFPTVHHQWKAGLPSRANVRLSAATRFSRSKVAFTIQFGPRRFAVTSFTPM